MKCLVLSCSLLFACGTSHEPKIQDDDPGTDPGTDPGMDPGTDPGTDPATDPGTDPGMDPEPDAPPAPVVGLPMYMPVDPTGTAASVFETKDDVYLRAQLATGNVATEGDYTFEVVVPDVTNPPQSGYMGSTDAPACRTFHLSATGGIGVVTPANGCEHGSITTSGGDLMIQLDPYLDAPPQCQATTGQYCVLIRNLDGTMATAASGTVCFSVRQPAKEGC